MNDVTIKEYLETRLTAQRDYFDERLRTMNVAVDKAEASMNTRLAGMNEFRQALESMTGKLATKEELEKTEDRIKTIELLNATAVGRTTVFSIVWAVISSVVVGLVMKLWLLK